MIKVITHIFSDHNTMKFEINHKKKLGKTTSIWRLKNIQLNNEWANQKIKEVKKNTWKSDNEFKTVQNFWDAVKAVIIGNYKAI